ncbi:MAG: Ig-like domain repeat protein, partial [Actinomycetota bacterium]
LDHTILFVGTGEGNNSADSFFGVGLYIIRNATTTADPTGPFNLDGTGADVFTGRAITQILVNPVDANKILVSTGSGFSGLSFDVFSTLPPRGVYLSTNALAVSPAAPTFARLSVPTATCPSATTSLCNRIVSDMVMDPGNPALVLVNVVGLSTTAGDGGVWSSDTDPFTGTATWTQRLPLGGTTGVVGKFAANRVGSTTTFALAASDSSACPTPTSAPQSGTLRTSLDGVTWTPVPGATGFCGGQCIYDAPVAIDPGSAKIIYIGGNADSSTAPTLSCGSTALAKTTDGAAFNRSDARLHPDSHAIAIAPAPNSNIIYTGNDGGIFKSTNSGATWTSLNNSTFSATQFQSLALHPADANFMIGGTQDNGTELMNTAAAWTRADAGDGGYSLIDQNAVDTTNVTMYHTYFNMSGATSGIIGYARVTSATNANETGWSFFGCPSRQGITLNGLNCADNVLFYAPMALGPGTPNTLYFGTDNLYRSPDQGVTMVSVSQAPLACCTQSGLNVPVSSIGISPQDDNVRIVGLVNGKVFATTTGANPIPEVTGPWGAHFVARAVIDPTNSNTAYITLDGYGFLSHVWKTTDLNAATPTWTAASGSLPDVPVNAFIIDPVFPNTLYAGTDIGVFNSVDGGASWVPYGTGLPRVAVFDMAMNKVSRKIRVATHGRGIFEIAAVNLPGSVGLLASNTSPATGASVTLTASVVQNPSLPVPTGTIAFDNGATVLGTVPLDATGTAALQTSSLPNGSNNLTAAYSGDANYAAATSAVVVVDVGAPDYSLILPKSSASILPGQVTTFSIEVSPQHGFSAPVTFSCSGVPTGANCSFSPGSVTPNGSAATTTLTITTSAGGLGAFAVPYRGAPYRDSPWLPVSVAMLLVAGMVVVGSGRKRRWQPLCLMLLTCAVLSGLVACGGSSTPPPPPATPAGTFTITVTATSGSTSHQSAITLTVK